MPFDESTTPPGGEPEKPQEAAQQPGETVGPQQYAGEDEPGPDANRQAGLLAQGAVPEAATTEIPVVDANEGAPHEVASEVPIKGPEGDTDPATQQWRKENWEYDKEKAHTMALAGDESRTAAADFRKKDGQYETAQHYDTKASVVEEEAGEKYDEEQEVRGLVDEVKGAIETLQDVQQKLESKLEKPAVEPKVPHQV